MKFYNKIKSLFRGESSKKLLKVLPVALVVVCVLCLAVGGTMAFLTTETKSIVNTFELGDFTYTLKLNDNKPNTEGTVSMPTVDPNAPQTVAAGSADFALSGNPSLVGYTFEGWYDEAGTTEYPLTSADGKTITVAYEHERVWDTDPAADKVEVELYAKWTPNTYTVVYDKNGGDNAGITGSTPNSTHTYDVEKSLTENGYERVGYTFTGWNTKADGTGTPYADNAPVINLTAEANGKVTLYAQWSARSYVIRYHANGGTGEMENQVIKYDVPTVLSANLFEKDDYTFFGWATSPDGKKVYNDKQTVVNLLESGYLDLYAVWEQDTHTVTFDYNGGTGSPASMQFRNGYPYGQLPEYPVHPTEKVADNKVMTYLFTGWYTEKTGGTRVYPETMVNRTDDHTLYAHWEAAPSNNVIQNMVVKNNPDDNKDGVVDDIYLEFTCTSNFEKYNIPLKNLVPGQVYKLTYTASNDASFGDYVGGYKNSVYGSYILADSALTGGRIESNYNENEYVAQVLANWNSRVEPDGNNDGSQAAKNDNLLQGPWKNKEIIFTATNSTMYWTWDFGLMQDNIQNNYNMTDIVLEPVVPQIKFGEKKLILHETSQAKVLNDQHSAYTNNFVFDGDGYAETMYFPITGLTAGSTYTITFDHKMQGALINNDSYNYGCGISSTEPNKYGSYMNSMGAEWISTTTPVFTKLNTTESVTLTFTAEGNTAYWVWNMANCSDTNNCTIDIKITKFSVKHSGGGSLTYYTAPSTASVVMKAVRPIVVEEPETTEEFETTEVPETTEVSEITEESDIAEESEKTQETVKTEAPEVLTDLIDEASTTEDPAGIA